MDSRVVLSVTLCLLACTGCQDGNNRASSGLMSAKEGSEAPPGNVGVVAATEGGGVWVEGYGDPQALSADVARRQLALRRKLRPSTSLVDVRRAYAQREAMADAFRSRAEYVEGIRFVLTKQGLTLTEPTPGPPEVKGSRYVTKALPSGMVVVRFAGQQRQGTLPDDAQPHTVTGECKTPRLNRLDALREARRDAIQRAAQMAAKAAAAADPPAETKGRIYVVETVSDAVTEAGYSITLSLIAVIE